LGIASYELDGTSGAGCREYVEGPTPGTGMWKLVDRNRTVTNTRLASDYEYCPQREVLQPTLGVAVQSSRIAGVAGELGYRRTMSSTVGLLGAADRLDHRDLGLYPNEAGQAPENGVNEERVHLRVDAVWRRGKLALRPFANARYSLLHAVLDRADLGLRLERGNHVLEPKLEYFYPTFDGDSIFNVFSIEPTADARLGYRYSGPIRATVNAWLRRYADEVAYAGGADASIERDITTRLRGRLDALWDGGYGGRRLGGSGEVGWRATPRAWLRARAIVLGVASDDDERPRYVTSTAVLSATRQLGDAAALHLVAESSYDERMHGQWRGLIVLDLAFTPEP
ncbi:MAG TPA: hypothetical protein VK427_02515, partial [Kofleriaceae bacterium]|nr:hypothetical protein [Kofleriaceae bacterium]